MKIDICSLITLFCISILSSFSVQAKPFDVRQHLSTVTSKQKKQNISYHVQVLHNEVPVPLPACGTDFCPFEVFKERVVDPLLNHEFKSICDTKKALRDVEVPGLCSWPCKFSNFLCEFLPSAQPQQEKSEF